HRAVNPRRDDVDLLARVGWIGSGGRIENRAGRVKKLAAGSSRIEYGVAGWNGNRDDFRVSLRGQSDVVVNELAPDVDHGRHQTVADDVAVALIGDHVADLARTGAVGAGRR